MSVAKRLGWMMGIGFCASALQAGAVDWEFYGIAKVKTFYEFNDAADGKTFADDKDTDTDFDMGLQANSRVGAKAKVNEELSGVAELGISDSSVTTRHLYGTWKFDGGALTIGQTRTPLGRQDSLRVWGDDAGLTAFGEPYLGRRPLLQLESHGLKVALVKPHSITNIYANTNATSEVDNLLPRVEASYQHKIGITSLEVFGGFHTYEISSTVENFDVQSGMAGAGFWIKPDPAYVRAIGYYSRNARQFGQYLSPQPNSFGSAKIVNDEVVNNDLFAGAVFGGYKFNDKFSAEIGYGYSQSEDDTDGAEATKWQCYYAQVDYKIAKGISVTPEFGVMEDIDSNKSTTYVGARWQASF